MPFLPEVMKNFEQSLNSTLNLASVSIATLMRLCLGFVTHVAFYVVNVLFVDTP